MKVEELKTENEQQQSVIKLPYSSKSPKKQIQLIVPNQFLVVSTVENTIPDLKPVVATGIPKSCADLRYMGHTSNGLYLIMGTKQVETVYCDFTVLPSDPSKTF